MRLFIAADLSNVLVDALTCTADALKRTVEGRFVSSEAYHITIAFLGEVDQRQIEAIEDVMDKACGGSHALQVTLCELGHFGKVSRATIWQGLKTSPELEALARRMRTGLEAAAIDFDVKPFKAHVTLARKVALGRADLDSYEHEAAGTIDTIVLYKSELSFKGARYSPVHTVELHD